MESLIQTNDPMSRGQISWCLILIRSCEGSLRFLLQELPVIFSKSFPHVDIFVTFVFAYVMLQALALLWGFLFNVGTNIGLYIGENVSRITSMSFQRAFAIFFVEYSMIQVILGFGRKTWIMTWQSLKNFPSMQNVLVNEGNPMYIAILVATPVLFMCVGLVAMPDYCKVVDESTTPIDKWICIRSPLKYFTASYKVFPRSLRLTLVIASFQYVQGFLYMFPNISDSLRERGAWTLHFIILSLVVLIFLSGGILMEWVFRHFQFKGTIFSHLSQSQWESIELAIMILWYCWFLFLTFETQTAAKWPYADSRVAIEEMFKVLKATFVFGQIGFFLRACIHPQMGFVHAQLELTVLNLLLPLLYVFASVGFRYLSRIDTTIFLIGTPLAFIITYLLYVFSEFDMSYGFIMVYIFIFGRILDGYPNFFMRKLMNKDITNGVLMTVTSKKKPVVAAVPTSGSAMGYFKEQRVAKLFVRLGLRLIVLLTVFLAVFSLLSVVQHDSEWYPSTMTLDRRLENGTMTINHASVVKLRLELFDKHRNTYMQRKGAATHNEYAICSGSWNSLSIIDYALLTEAAYFNLHSPEEVQEFLSYVFPSLSFEIYVPKKSFKKGRHLQFYEIFFPTLNTSVVSVKGTDIGRFSDVIEDVRMYSEPVMFIILSAIFPTIRIWPDITSSTFIEFYHELLLLFGFHHDDFWYHHSLLDYVQAIKNRNVVLTGHSIGGAISKIVGSISGIPSVTFSPPGIVQSYSKLIQIIHGKTTDVDRNRLHYQSLTVIPDYDPITMIDSQSGLVQRISCDTPHLSMQLSCHMIESTLCNLIQHCADPQQRFKGCSFEHRVMSLVEEIYVEFQAPSTIAGIIVAIAIIWTSFRFKKQRRL